MWKNIFIESCLLSALIFGGFYIYSKVLADEIRISDETIKAQSARQKLAHISGTKHSSSRTVQGDHLSGNSSMMSLGHLSGMTQELPTNQPAKLP